MWKTRNSFKRRCNKSVTEAQFLSTDELLNELKSRHDSSCFVGFRQLTKDKADWIMTWKGNERLVCGMLFRASYDICSESNEVK